MYNIVVIVGKAGSGKDSILREVVKQIPTLHKVIPYTTRPKREKENEGVDYFFISPDTFATKVIMKEMIECTEFNDWFYGTGYSSLDEDKINIGVFNPAAVDALCYDRDVRPQIFYIDASDKNRLLRQLNREEDPDVEEIVRRYKTDKIDFAGIEYDFEGLITLTNNTKEDFNKCVETIVKAIKDKFDTCN